MTTTVFIVDVFAEQAYAGNPLAVVIGAECLSDETMQRFAAEMNFSETTFVTSAPEADGGYRVRVFTPAREIAFTGHPILGTAWVIRHHLGAASDRQVRLNLAVGPVVATFGKTDDGGEVVWFRAPPMSLGRTCATSSIAKALGLDELDIDDAAPVQVVSAGTSAIMVPLRSNSALGRARLDLDAFAPLAAQGFPPLTYLFTTATEHTNNDLRVRFFFEAHGPREDPATGNGAAFLGAWLLAHRFMQSSDLSLRIEQGTELRRPSLILLRASLDGDEADVRVGGRVVPILQGRLV